MTVEALFLIAFILLILEAFVPSLGIFGLGGFIAFVSGLVVMFNSDMGTFYGLSFGAIAALGCLIFLSFAVFGIFAYRSFRKKVTTGTEAMIGQSATVTIWNGHKGKVVYEGEDWRAASDNIFKKGDIVRITGLDKMTLTVEKEK